MSLFLARRIVSLIVTLIVASLIIFAVLAVIPGDPARLMLGIGASEDAIAALREEMGLNQPLAKRYLDWVTGIFSGDFGKSLTYSSNVGELISQRIWVSLPLALMALFFSTLIAIPVGVYAAARRGRFVDTLIMALTQIGIAIPNFWFGLLMAYLFAVVFRLVPSGGFPGWGAGFGAAFISLLLPAIALALPQAAILARIARSALVETLNEDYIRTARAKGLTKRATLWHHALRNAMIPVTTIMGLQFAYLLAGTIIIEQVFYLPGLGRLIFQAISQNDLPVVQNTVLLLVAAIVFINFCVDMIYALIDPRLRRQ